MSAPLRVLGIAGSLRAKSFNRALVRAAMDLAPESMNVTLYERLGDIPPYNADVDAAGAPEAVLHLKQAIRDHDALLVATPEYNYGVPGVLKNAVDWASRPAKQSVLNRKPVAVMGAAARTSGTMRAQLALRQNFLFTETLVLPKPEVYVTFAGEKFDESGRLTDETTREHVRRLLDALAAWVRLVAGSPP